ncbi:MAG: hypothetical protein IKJ93_02130, partial [Clostridia bacterium]|nr:hypothetical protein [Clostridia bacterium]
MFEYEIIKKRNGADENKKTNFSFEITKGKNQNTNKSNETDFSFEITKKRAKAVQDDNQSVDYSNFTSFFEMENGKLPTFDTVVRRMGYENVGDYEEYSKKNPELFEAMGGVKYDPVNAPVKTPSVSKVAANNVVKRFKNTDVKAVGEIFKTLAIGEWQDADTMKGYTEKVNQYVNDFVALDSMGYFNYLPTEERKGYVEELRSIKKYANNLKEVFSGYDDSDSYKDAVIQAKNQAIMYEKMENEDLDVLRKQINEWKNQYRAAKKEYDEWDVPIVGTLDKYTTERTGVITYYNNREAQRLAEIARDKTIKQKYGYSPDEFKDMIVEKEAYYNKAKYIQDGIKIKNDARNDGNYDKWSQEGATFSPNDFGKITIDVTERIGHISSSSIDKYRAAAIALSDWQSGETTKFSNSVTNGESLTSKYRLMNKDEFKDFAYWRKYDKENGTKFAYDYIDSVEETLNIREGQAIGEEYKDKHALLKIMYGVEAGFDQFASGVSNAFNFTDEYIPTTSTQYASQIIRDDLWDAGPNLPEWLGGTSLGQAAFDFVTTTTNMVPSLAVGGMSELLLPGSGTYVTAGLMGLSASGNAYQQMLNEGYNKTQSRTYATLVGLSEASLSALLSGMIGGKASEKAIENVIKGIDKGFLRFAVRWGMSAASEIPEESLQTLIEPILQNIALGYEKNKLEDTDWSQVAYDGLLGGISGLGLGGVTSAVSTGVEQHTWNKAGKNVRANETIQNVLDIAQLSPQESDAYATYTRYANNGINAENITDTQIGRLYDELNTYAKGVLNNKRSPVDAKANATKVLSELSKADEKSTVDKDTIAKFERSVAYEGALHESVDALIESGLESGENTKSHKLAIELQNKIRNGKEVTTQEIVKLQEANEKAFVDEAQIELKNRAQHYEKNQAELFVNIYDKNVNGDIEAYQNSFNLVSELVENSFSLDYILERRGALTTEQVKSIYNEKVLNSKIAFAKELESLRAEHKSASFVSGSVDMSVIDFGNSIEGEVRTPNGNKINWNMLDTNQQAAITGVSKFAKDMGMEVVWISDGIERGINGAFEVNGNRMLIDVYAGKNKVLNLNMRDAIIPTVSHELVHWAKEKSPKIYRKLDAFVFESLARVGIDEETALGKRRREMEKTHPGVVYTDAEVREEVIARACEDMLANTETFRECLGTMTESEKRTLLDKVREIIKNIKEWVDTFLKEQKSDSAEAKATRKDMTRFLEQVEIFEAMVLDATLNNQALHQKSKTTEKNTTEKGGVKYSLVGRTVDDIGIYKTNYPEGTPKSIKQNDLISLIQNIWSNNPINLKIIEDGTVKEIKAKFNPELSGRSDLSKIVFGNRKGNGSERRMTLDLSSDLYQIAADSRYLYSKDAIPKPNNHAHDGVIKYHYFITNLVYEDNENNYTSCHMNIDVKQNSDGNWFYSFAIEKGSVPQTLLAAVTENSATLPINSISQTSKKSQEKWSERNTNFFSRAQEKHTSTNQLGREAEKNTTDKGGVKFMVRDKVPTGFNPDGKSLREQLKEAYNTAISKERRYVYIGEFTKEFIDKLKNHISIKNYPIVMNYRDAYISMQSKENGKYQGQGINYHNLGIEGLESALLSFESPEYVILSKAKNRIELVLEGRDYKNRQIFSIVEVNTSAQHSRKNLSAHVVNSVYGKSNLNNLLVNAENEQRIIYNKNEEQPQVMPQVQYERDINDYSSKNSISQAPQKNQEKPSDIDTDIFFGIKEKYTSINQLGREAQKNTTDEGGVKFMVRDKVPTDFNSDELQKTMYADRDIIGKSGTNYGKGVYLDSDKLAKLGEEERIDEVKKHIENLGGVPFTAFDNEGNEVKIKIAPKTKYINENGKPARANRHLTNFLDSQVKQKSLMLIDKVILTARFQGEENAEHPHGWLDNYGKNKWEIWTTYIQDEEKTIWEAKLKIANSTNGEKILYDVYPIEMVEQVGTMTTSTTNDNISQDVDESQEKLFDRGTDIFFGIKEKQIPINRLGRDAEKNTTDDRVGSVTQNIVDINVNSSKQINGIDTNEFIKGLREKENKSKQDEGLQSSADGFIDNANDTNYNDSSIEEGERSNGKNTELLERGTVSAVNRGDDL